MMDVAHTNSVTKIRQNNKVTAINSALSVDITGQVCADSIGIKHFSGVGGQIDFIRGAGYSEGGKPIIALPSITAKGISKISPTLLDGSGVVTTVLIFTGLLQSMEQLICMGSPCRTEQN